MIDFNNNALQEGDRVALIYTYDNNKFQSLICGIVIGYDDKEDKVIIQTGFRTVKKSSKQISILR